MMKRNLIKIAVCILIIMALLFVVERSFATDSNGDIFNELSNLNSNNEAIPQANRADNEPTIIENSNTNNNQLNNNTTNIANNTNTNTNENKPATTPYTGIGSTPTILFIVLFAGSTIYAYKKIRDYEN